MTIQIGRGEVIAGVPTKDVRDLFRYVVAWHRDSFELTLLQERLSLEENAALALTQELITLGYIVIGENGTYAMTDKGSQLVRASASGEIKRTTAERALTGLLQRTEAYNADPNKILTVEAIIVFGSFLGTKEKLGDLDVAVKHRDRDHIGGRTKAKNAYAEKSGRSFSNIVEFLSWPETELCQILKARKRTIRIQDWHSFVRMVASNTQLDYEVVFGDSEEVKAKIALEVENRRKQRLDSSH
jgi:hypothetical protein